MRRLWSDMVEDPEETDKDSEERDQHSEEKDGDPSKPRNYYVAPHLRNRPQTNTPATVQSLVSLRGPYPESSGAGSDPQTKAPATVQSLVSPRGPNPGARSPNDGRVGGDSSWRDDREVEPSAAARDYPEVKRSDVPPHRRLWADIVEDSEETDEDSEERDQHSEERADDPSKPRNYYVAPHLRNRPQTNTPATAQSLVSLRGPYPESSGAGREPQTKASTNVQSLVSLIGPNPGARSPNDGRVSGYSSWRDDREVEPSAAAMDYPEVKPSAAARDYPEVKRSDAPPHRRLWADMVEDSEESDEHYEERDDDHSKPRNYYVTPHLRNRPQTNTPANFQSLVSLRGPYPEPSGAGRDPQTQAPETFQSLVLLRRPYPEPSGAGHDPQNKAPATVQSLFSLRGPYPEPSGADRDPQTKAPDTFQSLVLLRRPCPEPSGAGHDPQNKAPATVQSLVSLRGPYPEPSGAGRDPQTKAPETFQSLVLLRRPYPEPSGAGHDPQNKAPATVQSLVSLRGPYPEPSGAGRDPQNKAPATVQSLVSLRRPYPEPSGAGRDPQTKAPGTVQSLVSLRGPYPEPSGAGRDPQTKAPATVQSLVSLRGPYTEPSGAGRDPQTKAPETFQSLVLLRRPCPEPSVAGRDPQNKAPGSVQSLVSLRGPYPEPSGAGRDPQTKAPATVQSLVPLVGLNPGARSPNDGRGSGDSSSSRVDDREPSASTDQEALLSLDAYENIPVEIRGVNVPPPVNTFAETDLAQALKEIIERSDFVKPTPVQRHALPILLAGRDLIACARTGSGKTMAFCFPIISGIIREPRRKTSRTTAGLPLALILTPTRELAWQIHHDAKRLAETTEVRVVSVHGGAKVDKQIKELSRGVDILVATPGRLIDFHERDIVSFQMIRYLAIDEADRMLGREFERQIRVIVEQLDMTPTGERQTMIFSATFPEKIQELASSFLSAGYVFFAVARVGSGNDSITSKVVFVEAEGKRSLLLELLQDQSMQARTLVFVNNKREAESLEDWLGGNGFPAISIHGGKSQMDREYALDSFKRGDTPILVATEAASRGMEIPNVAHVVNFDFPHDIDRYVRRIGKTGRAAGVAGMATTFFNKNDLKMAKPLYDLMQETNQEVPTWLLPYADGSNHGWNR